MDTVYTVSHKKMPTPKTRWLSSEMGKVQPAGRIRPSDSFSAARRQQQKRFNVRPFEKS